MEIKHKAYIIPGGFFLILILFAYYIYFSPLLMLVGAYMLVAIILHFIFVEIYNKEAVSFNIGCFSLLFFAVVCLGGMFGDQYYIGSMGGKKHIYKDCQYLKGECHQVTSMSAFIWGCSDKCEKCKERKEKEIAKKREEIKIKIKKENIEFIDEQIQELLEVKRRLLNDEYVDVEDYEFRIDIEDELTQSEENEDYDYEPRGRYR